MPKEPGLKKIGKNITEEEAKNTAVPVSEVIVASILHSGAHRYVGTAFQTMFDTPHFTMFIEIILKNVTKALASGVPGFKVRHEMAQHLHQMENALREEAGRTMLAFFPALNLEMSEELDNLVETARVIGEAARRLQNDFDEAASTVVKEGHRQRLGQRLAAMAGVGIPPSGEDEPQAH